MHSPDIYLPKRKATALPYPLQCFLEASMRGCAGQYDHDQHEFGDLRLVQQDRSPLVTTYREHRSVSAIRSIIGH
jgi:hypothetical protein